MFKICKRGHEWNNDTHKQCPQCAAEAQARYYKKNSEKIIEQKAKYYKENSDKVAARQAKWNKENSEKITANKVKYYKENSDKIAERKAKWRRENPDKIAKSHERRAAAIKRQTPTWLTDAELAQMQRVWNNKPSTHAVDHIVPIQGAKVSGLNVPWNLQYLPKKQNLFKGIKFDFTNENESWKLEYIKHHGDLDE